MMRVITANKEQDAVHIRELFWEYLRWANSKVNEEFGVSFDIGTILEADMSSLDKFKPPKGRLLLAYADDRLAGIACLKELTSPIGEIKRMYVRPEARKRGLSVRHWISAGMRWMMFSSEVGLMADAAAVQIRQLRSADA